MTPRRLFMLILNNYSTTILVVLSWFPIWSAKMSIPKGRERSKAFLSVIRSPFKSVPKVYIPIVSISPTDKYQFSTCNCWHKILEWIFQGIIKWHCKKQSLQFINSMDWLLYILLGIINVFLVLILSVVCFHIVFKLSRCSIKTGGVIQTYTLYSNVLKYVGILASLGIGTHVCHIVCGVYIKINDIDFVVQYYLT